MAWQLRVLAAPVQDTGHVFGVLCPSDLGHQRHTGRIDILVDKALIHVILNQIAVWWWHTTLITLEEETGGSLSLRPACLRSEFQENQDYTEKPCLEQKKKKEKKRKR